MGAEKRAVEKGKIAAQLKAIADAKAAVSVKAADSATELVSKVKATNAVLTQQEEMAATAEKQNAKAEAVVTKAKSDEEFATDVHTQHLEGSASEHVKEVAENAVESAEAHAKLTTKVVAQAKAAHVVTEAKAKSEEEKADAAKAKSARLAQAAIEAH